MGTEGDLPAEIDREADGTVVIRFVDGIDVDEDNASRLRRRHVAIADGQARPTLVDLRGMRSVDLAARRIGSGPEITAVVRRMALLVGSPATRVIGSFFLRVQSPQFPTRVFNDEQRARAWLHEDES